MVQFIHAVLRNALQAAVREEIIPRNVAMLVTVTTPKYEVNRGLTVDQAREVIQVARDERLYALYVLALCLGLRRGELLGLRWEDVKLVGCRACGGEGGTPDGDPCGRCAESGIESATLSVVQTLQRVGGALRFVPPKTDDSTRTVPLPELRITALCEHKIRQESEKTDAWPNWQDHGLVFSSLLGTPMEPDNLRRSWGRIREAAGLGSVRFHDIRHTCVSLLLDLGVRPRDRWAQRHRSHDDDLRARRSRREAEGAREAQGRPRLMPLSSALSSKGPEPEVVPGLWVGRSVWAGAGSNRRPSAFQADARTD
jgi:integrase